MTGRKRNAGLSAMERRALLQLGASVLLFLLVFVGRGVLPEQMTQWREMLNADVDFGGAVTAFGRNVSEDGVAEALRTLWADVTGMGEAHALESVSSAAPQAPLTLPTPREQMEDPSFGSLPSMNGSGADETAREIETPAPPVESTPVPEEVPVVTAAAQAYSDSGEKLPDNVSFQYYNLGLEETVHPVVGPVTSPFGYRDHPVSGKYSFHTAQDIGVKRGTDVLAFAAGTVRYIGESDIYGLYVRLDHDNGVSTFYAHCQELLVKKGDTVACGQTIARSGATGNATGPHLHFSIDKDGVRLDPAWYLHEPG